MLIRWAKGKDLIGRLKELINREFDLTAVHLFMGKVFSPPFWLEINDKNFAWDLIEYILGPKRFREDHWKILNFFKGKLNEKQREELIQEIQELATKELRKMLRRELFLKRVCEQGYQLLLYKKGKQIPIQIFKG
ncbi:MAG: hypothetical protein AB7D02_00075 [Candidatus Paceibacterota bacterium]